MHFKNISSLKPPNSETVDCSLKRSLRRKLVGMGQRQQHDRETEQLVGEQHSHDPREDTEFLIFCEKIAVRADLFEENHGTIDDCTTTEIVGLEEKTASGALNFIVKKIIFT